MKSKIIGIYMITSPSNKIYIGQSRNIYRRWSAYKDLKVNKHPRLHNSLLKYGIENHIFEIVEQCKFEQLNIRERYWQDFYDATGKRGLNCTLTATDTLPRVISEETRDKLRRSKLGELNHNYKGGEYTNRVKNKTGIIKSRSGENNPFFGKTHTEHVKEKMRKKVIDTSTGIIYGSLTEAGEILNIKKATLSAYLLGKISNKTTFLYLSDVEKLNNV